LNTDRSRTYGKWGIVYTEYNFYYNQQHCVRIASCRVSYKNKKMTMSSLTFHASF
jgi:hypothetical protein